MTKKITLIGTAIALVAFAVPAFADAAPQVTYPAGTTLPTGTAITATSTNWVTTTSYGSTNCAKVSIPGELTRNTGTLVEVVGTGGATTTTCRIEGEAISVTDLTLTNLKSDMSGSGTVTFSFKQDLPVVGTCSYTGTSLPFTYTSGGSSIKFSKATFSVSPSACGTMKLDADFSLEKTSGGSALVLD